MKEIIRQKDEWAREAVKDIAEGRASQMLEAYYEHGLLNIAPDREKARQALIAEWKKEGVQKPEDNLIITGTNKETTILNRWRKLCVCLMKNSATNTSSTTVTAITKGIAFCSRSPRLHAAYATAQWGPSLR